MLHFIIRFASCTLLFLSSAILFAQEAPVAPAQDPANPQVYFHLDRMVVKGLTEKDFKIFPAHEHDELTYEKGDKKIPVQYSAYFDYSNVVRQVILCNIQASYDKKLEKDGPTKEELTPVIIKHTTERVNKLMVLKRSPTMFTINRLREEINRHTMQLTELRKQEEALVRKVSFFSPQTAEELKSKLWTQKLDLQSQIDGNQTMIAELQKEIDRLTKAVSTNQENREMSIAINNLDRMLRAFHTKLTMIEKNPDGNDREITSLRLQIESAGQQIAELEEKIFRTNQTRSKEHVEELEKKLVELRGKLSDARAAYRNPKHPSISELEQLLKPLEEDRRRLRRKIISAVLNEVANEDVSALPALRAKLSEARIANDVLIVKRDRVTKALDDVSNASEGSIDLENKRNDIKQHQRAIDQLNEKLLDARMKIELESQSFELVPLK